MLCNAPLHLSGRGRKSAMQRKSGARGPRAVSTGSAWGTQKGGQRHGTSGSAPTVYAGFDCGKTRRVREHLLVYTRSRAPGGQRKQHSDAIWRSRKLPFATG